MNGEILKICSFSIVFSYIRVFKSRSLHVHDVVKVELVYSVIGSIKDFLVIKYI